MTPTAENLVDVALRYYPQGIPESDPRYTATAEHRRLLSARIEAGAQRAPWRAMVARLCEQLPGRDVDDQVACCPPEWLRASYEGRVELPLGPGEQAHCLYFLVSFLVPYYVVYATRTVEAPRQVAAVERCDPPKVLVATHDPPVLWALPRAVVRPEVAEEHDRWLAARGPGKRRDVHFDLATDEQLAASHVVREIEATYGYAPMAPDVGQVVVPDVETGLRSSGEVTLYDCLFTEIR